MALPIKHPQLTVKSAEVVAGSIKRIVLADQDDWPLPPFLPGAHVDLHLPNGMVRTYSLCNEPGDNRRYVIAVKREPGGRGGSRYVHDALRPGTTLGVSLPRAGLAWDDGAMTVLVAGGIGATPFISLVRHFERQGCANYVFHWLSRGRPALLDMVRGAFDAGRVVVHDTQAAPRPGIAALIAGHDARTRYACCGAEGLVEAFARATAHVPPRQVHIERFAPPMLAVPENEKPYLVVLAKSARQATVEPGVGLMRTLETLDAGVSFSCEGGICGACQVRWLEGEPVHRDRVLDPGRRATHLMACVAGCASDRLVLDI